MLIIKTVYPHLKTNIIIIKDNLFAYPILSQNSKNCQNERNFSTLKISSWSLKQTLI